MVEFEVMSEVESTSTKTNSKGEVVEIDVVMYGLREKKSEKKPGKAITMSIRVEGQRDFTLTTGDVLELKFDKKQKRLDE
jgi:hypothetical protein